MEENMDEKIKRAEKMCLKKYGLGARITFNIQGFDVGLDMGPGPNHYHSGSKMIREIKSILGPFSCTDVYRF
jgi:hypothetical protein